MQLIKKTRAIFSVLLLFSICLIGFAQSTSETEEIGYIIFASDSTNFENAVEARGSLDKYAENISQIPSKEKQIYINGYTAIFNNDVDQIKLSSDRANVVLDELILRGISAERFDIIKANGGTANWGNNEISANRKPNRRVTISIGRNKEIAQITAISDTEPEIEENTPQNTVKQEKSAGKINWKKIAIIAGIIIAVIIIALVIIYVIVPAIGAAGAGSAATGAGGVAKGIKGLPSGVKKAGGRIVKTGSRVAREGVRAAKNTVYRGGKYGDLTRIPGTEKHHMPPWNSFPQNMKNMTYDEVPAIQMDIADHQQTLGHSGKGLDEIYKLMGDGKYKEVVQKMVQDVQQKFPGKYDEAIKEFLPEAEKYEKTFLENLKNIKGVP